MNDTIRVTIHHDHDAQEPTCRPAGFRQGVEFQKARSASMPQPQPQPPQSVFGRDEPPYPHGER